MKPIGLNVTYGSITLADCRVSNKLLAIHLGDQLALDLDWYIMKTPFSFKLGNRGLLPHEEGVVDDINAALEASARKHNLTLTAAAKFRIKSVPSAGEPVRRVTSEAILLAVPAVAGAEEDVPFE